MMFDISQSDLPILQTRRALIVIDLQKGLIDEAGLVPTHKPSNLIQNVEALIPIFRQTGTIIWVTSKYEKHRAVNSGTAASENIIANGQVNAVSGTSGYRPALHASSLATRYLQSAPAQLRPGHGSSPSLLSADMDHDSIGISMETLDAEDPDEDPGDLAEAFLSVQPGTEGARRLGDDNPPALLDVLQAASRPKDMYFTKSHYSAFKSGSLIQTLRRNFITELFICGALSNTSVYATAMDATQHGMGITLIDDCLGWRGNDRHHHALALLEEATGCDTFSSEDIIKDIQQKQARTTAKRPVRHQENEELATMLGMLNLCGKANTRPVPEANDEQGEITAPMVKPSMVTTNIFGVEDESLAALPRPTRGTVVAGQPRVKSKIMHRRDFEDKDAVEPKVKIESKPNKKEILSTTASKGELSEELPAKAHIVANLEDRSCNAQLSRSETKTCKSDPRASMSVKIPMDKLEIATKNKSPIQSCDEDTPPDGTKKRCDEMPRLVEGSLLCEGDTVVIADLLPPTEANDIFERLKAEVRWQRMSHQGGEVPRLVAVQGEIGNDGEIPVYRHPADESPPLLAFSPTVSLIRREVEKATGHAVNHALIQYYRDGKDYISEHSDKTLDIVPNTYIANVSLGAERTMVFRGKRDAKDTDSVSSEIKPRNTARANLPHNSMMRMGLMTNMKWMHSIRQDKRREQEKTAAELDFGGCRISLTFRLIGTFLSRDQRKIWGQGAVAKDEAHARGVVNGPTEEATRMIQAFSLENRANEFDWQEVYGHGFDVLHMSNSRKLLLSGDKLIDDGVKAMLGHLGLEWTPSSITAPVNADSGAAEQPLIKLVDTDVSRSIVEGHAATLLYLDAVHGRPNTTRTPFDYAKLYTRLHLATHLAASDVDVKALDVWETFAAEDVYIAGREVSIVDFAFFPVLHGIKASLGNSGLQRLEIYYRRMGELATIKKVLEISDSE